MDFSWTLNEDVLVEIFNLLGRKTLLNASLVCRRWHEIAQQIIDSTITLAVAQVYGWRNRRLFKRILSEEAFGRGIRRVVVRDWHHSGLEKMSGHWPWLDGAYFAPTYAGPSDARWKNTRGQIESLARGVDILKLRSFTWAAVPHIPNALINVLQRNQDQCQVEIWRNELWSENAIGAYTPFMNQYALAKLDALPNIVRLELVVAPADSGLLERLGTLLISRKHKLRSFNLTTFGRVWPEGRSRPNWTSPSSPTDDRRTFLVQSTKWLAEPLGDKRGKLRLTEFELTNVCVCESARPTRLDELIDADGLVSLKLSCFSLLKHCSPLHFSSLNNLALGHRNGYINEKERCKPDWSSESARSFLTHCKKSSSTGPG